MDHFRNDILLLLIASDEFREKLGTQLKESGDLHPDVQEHLDGHRQRTEAHHDSLQKHRDHRRDKIWAPFKKYEDLIVGMHSNARKNFDGKRAGGAEFEHGMNDLLQDAGVDREDAKTASSMLRNSMGNDDELGFFVSFISGLKPEGYDEDPTDTQRKFQTTVDALGILKDHMPDAMEKTETYESGRPHSESPDHARAMAAKTIEPHINDLHDVMGNLSTAARQSHSQAKSLDSSEKNLHPEIAKHMQDERQKPIEPKPPERPEGVKPGEWGDPTDPRMARFDKFLRWNFGQEGGKTLVPNTNKDTRGSHPKVQVFTLLKSDPPFRQRLMKEFQEWQMDD